MEKKLYGYFKRQTGEISHKKTGPCDEKETLKKKLNLFEWWHKTTPFDWLKEDQVQEPLVWP